MSVPKPFKKVGLATLNWAALALGILVYSLFPPEDLSWKGGSEPDDLVDAQYDILQVLLDMGPCTHAQLRSYVNFDDSDPDALPFEVCVAFLWQRSPYMEYKKRRFSTDVYEITAEGREILKKRT